jgi:1-deoxy-D-xylulose-5-phosphate synthase
VPESDVGRGLSARRVLGPEPGSSERADVCLLAVGKMVEAAEEAADKLAAEGVTATVWDVRLVRPLDPMMIADAARHPMVVTVEDGIRIGGAGSAMADAIAALGDGRRSPPVLILGTPLAYIPQGKPDQIHAQVGLDGPGIAASTLTALADHSPMSLDVD